MHPTCSLQMILIPGFLATCLFPESTSSSPFTPSMPMGDQQPQHHCSQLSSAALVPSRELVTAASVVLHTPSETASRFTSSYSAMCLKFTEVADRSSYLSCAQLFFLLSNLKKKPKQNVHQTQHLLHYSVNQASLKWATLYMFYLCHITT